MSALIGIDTTRSHFSRTSRDKPFPSLPTMIISDSCSSFILLKGASDSPARPTTKQPAFFASSIARGRLLTCATGIRAAAPAEAFHADAVIAAARLSAITTPSAPNADALRTIAPRLRGSVTPSRATISIGFVARMMISSRLEYWKGLIARRIPWLLPESPSTSAR